MGYFKTISPQGDGNDKLYALLDILLEGISKPYPRKGTETMIDLLLLPIGSNFKTISPQGDGNARIASIMINAPNFKTISPQGDGNRARTPLSGT